jgi:hypothetical protein
MIIRENRDCFSCGLLEILGILLEHTKGERLALFLCIDALARLPHAKYASRRVKSLGFTRS